MSKLTTSVGEHGGVPRLFINGRPDPGIIYSHRGFLFDNPENAYYCIRRLREKGIRIYRDVVMIRPRPDGSLDTSEFDRQVGGLLEIDPDLLFMARILMPRPPDWWIERNPGHLMVHRDQYTGEFIDAPPEHDRASFASPVWRRDVRTWVDRIVRYCEEQYGETIMGYFLHGGFFEWAYYWDNVLSDYSEAQTGGFRRWLREEYADVGALREAWKQDDVDFQSAEIPILERTRMRPKTPALLHPVEDRRIVDYLVYHSEVVADALDDMAGALKQTLRDLNAEKICGAWYGYEFWPAGMTGAYHNSGHHAMQRAFGCDDVDMYSLIHSHFERKPGGLWVHHMAGSSVVAHGKLLYEEDDTSTHAAENPLPWQQFCATARESEGVLSRNFMGILASGGSIYWHDFSGERWFGPDEIVEHIGRLVNLFEEEFDRPFRPRARVAAFVSKRSKRYFRQDAALTDALYCRQISELLHAGAPVDVYYAEDIPMLVEQGRLADYRVLMFMDCFMVPPPMREAIREGLACGGRTLIWCYGTGFIEPDGFSAESMTDLTAIPVEIGMDGQSLKAATHYTGTLVQYGPNAALSPVIKGRPEPGDGVEVWGRYIQPDAPALMIRQLDHWRSVWSGAPSLPAVVLRRMLRDAGVHIHTDSGDQVFAVNDLLAVHACYTGTRTITLPMPCAVRDAFTGEVLHQRCEEFEVELQRADTPVWRLER